MQGPLCYICKHYSKDNKCSAFPKGIPAKILLNEADHRKPYPGDNGTRYEPLDPKPETADAN